VTRLLIISPDKTGPLMAGTAIRSVEIARALADECAVTLAVPEGSATVPGPFAQVCVPTDSPLPALIEAADVVLISGRAELMSAVRKPLIVDLYDPFILSDLEFYGTHYTAAGGRPLLALRWLQHHLEHGDLFVCASQVQRSFWLGMLAAAGRVNRANYAADRGFDELLAVLPFGIPSTPPVATAPAVKGVIPGIDADDVVVLWAGGLWNWFDPLTLLRALHVVRRDRPQVKGLFLGVRHPNADIGIMEMGTRALTLARELGLDDRGAFFVDWVPYEARQNYLLESDVAVSLHQAGVEAQFAFRTRVLDYIWCSLPMVVSRGDELAARIVRERVGIAVPEGDVDAVAAALVTLLDTPAHDDRRARFAALRDELAWTRVVEPVRRFCRAPHPAPDKANGAWFAPHTEARAVLHKEDALISEEVLSGDREVSLPLGKYYRQSYDFTATYDNLCRVDALVWRATESPPAVDLLFTLNEEGPSGRRLARVAVALADLPRDDWQRFEFRPIPNSRGRRYRATFEIPGTTASDTSLWLCRTAADAEPAPALMLRYLVKGVIEELPVDEESFLFLHNTTVSDNLVPGLGAAVAADDRLAAALRGGSRAPAPGGLRSDASAGNGHGDAISTTAPPSPGTAPPANHDRDTIHAELARLTAALEMTRRELTELGAAHAAAVATPRILPALARELGHGVRASLGACARLCGLALVLALVVLSIPPVLVLAVALACTDALTARRRAHARPRTAAEVFATPAAAAAPGRRLGPDDPVSVVIPTWNGRSLLDMSLPPLRQALAAHPPGGEIIVVDNGSEDDTCAHLAATFPDVRVVALARNEGFGGATNRGVRASRHPVVILLNNDMVVEPDFIGPLLAAFTEEPDVFGVSCQIDFIDKTKARWETGKVHARWKNGTITLFHVDRWEDDLLYPIFFAGGGASAYDREKFLALDGFDEAVFSPVYIEDVDLGYRAWKRGWPSLFAPRSMVHHKHRGTTRRLWSESLIYSFFVKNLAALVWKNVDDWRLLGRHLAGLVVLPLRVFRQAGTRAAVATWQGWTRQIPRLIAARAREAGSPRVLADATIFHASRYRHAYRGYFGRRRAPTAEARPKILLVSPYSPYPPIHGGAVRMLALLERLQAAADVTVISYADTEAELDPRSIMELRKRCHQAVLLERDTTAVGGILAPGKTRGFWSSTMSDTVEFFLDRDDFDILQVEYTHMAHFLPPRVPGLLRVLVEHDVSYVSMARSQITADGRAARLGAWFDWMRMLRYETRAVEDADFVITMSDTDRALLGRFVDPAHVVTVPNGVDCRRFTFAADGREPQSLLFVGFFRHEPNVEAVRYFCREVLPLVRRTHPQTRFRIVGSYPPDAVRRLGEQPGIEVTGRVEDIGAYYRTSAVFVVPVLQGSGTRLKILEAMASGCPVVSTTIGAEGIDVKDGAEMLIADSAEAMAAAIDRVLRDPALATRLAARARDLVARCYDWDVIAARMLDAFRARLGRTGASGGGDTARGSRARAEG
jgi:glycosyltransferase involved in cell wall biosynthesis/GT2 family glycosyltransferase